MSRDLTGYPLRAMSRETVLRTAVGVCGFAIVSAILVISAKPDQRGWLLVVVGLIVLGSAISIYGAWRKRRR